MAGLDYSLDELDSPNKTNTINRAFDAIKAIQEKEDVVFIGHHEFKETVSITQLPLDNPALTGDLVGDLDPEKTDGKRTKKFFVDTRQLDMCIAQAENLQDMLHSEMMAMKVLGILSFGLRKSGELLADAIYEHKMAKVDLKRAQAVASLEKFYEYALERKLDASVDLKATDKTKDHYINIDAGVMKAAEKEALFEAMVSQLDTYKTQFTMAMSGVKAMISKQRGDSLISGAATPTVDDPSDKDNIPF